VTAKASNILAGVAGLNGTASLAWVADPGTALPTDESTALNVAFKDMGFVTPDGVTINTNTSTQEITAYGTFSVVRTLIESEVKTFTITGEETNPITAAVKARLSIAAAPTPGVGTGKYSYTEGAARDVLYSFVLHAVDGTNIIRKVFPSIRMTALADEQIAKAKNVDYGFTMTAYPDSNGNSVYTYIAQPSLG